MALLQSLLVLVGLALVAAAETNNIGKDNHFRQLNNNQTTDSGTLRSLIIVYADPSPGTSLYVKLYSGDDIVDRVFTSFGSVEFSFTAGISTKFWVDSTWSENGGVKYITKARVFGDGVPKKSGTWWVDSVGLKRVKEDSNSCPPCYQYPVYWQ